MYIANPIYDTVFKYLLEDKQIAKTFIGTIIGRKVLELDARPQERSVVLEDYTLTFFRLDYKAVIETETGEQLKVLIELQKAIHFDDIVRFRRYLGENYKTPEEVGEEKISLPIVAIYLLGDKLSVESPFIKVLPDCYDIITGEPVIAEDNFIKLLNHESYFIQIKRLSGSMKHKLERLLSVFDQKRLANHKDKWILEYTDLDGIEDEDLRKIAKRLGEILFNEEMMEQVRTEEEIENELDKLLRRTREAEERAEEAHQQAEEAKVKVEVAEKQIVTERSAKIQAIKKMTEMGVSLDIIAISFFMSLTELNNLLSEG